MKLHELAHPMRPCCPPSLTASASSSGPSKNAPTSPDRPPFNVVSMLWRDQLLHRVRGVDADERIRVIVLRGAGEHFSSGGDIRAFAATPEHVSKLAWNVAAPARCSKPVIAAGRGYCFGVGFELSLACDFRLATETTLYALPEQKLGQIPDPADLRACRRWWASRAPRTSSCARAALPAARPSSGAWPPTVPDGELEKATDALVDELRAFSPIAQRTAKKLLNDTEDSPLSIAIELEATATRACAVRRTSVKGRGVPQQAQAELRRPLIRSIHPTQGGHMATESQARRAVAGRRRRRAGGPMDHHGARRRLSRWAASHRRALPGGAGSTTRSGARSPSSCPRRGR